HLAGRVEDVPELELRIQGEIWRRLGDGARRDDDRRSRVRRPKRKRSECLLAKRHDYAAVLSEMSPRSSSTARRFFSACSAFARDPETSGFAMGSAAKNPTFEAAAP